MNPSSPMNPSGLSASELIEKAMPAHLGNEKNLDFLFQQLMNPANGKVIHLPGNPKALSVTGPSEREIQQITVQAMRVLFQTVRLLMLATESIDLRLRGWIPEAPGWVDTGSSGSAHEARRSARLHHESG